MEESYQSIETIRSSSTKGKWSKKLSATFGSVSKRSNVLDNFLLNKFCLPSPKESHSEIGTQRTTMISQTIDRSEWTFGFDTNDQFEMVSRKTKSDCYQAMYIIHKVSERDKLKTMEKNSIDWSSFDGVCGGFREEEWERMNKNGWMESEEEKKQI